MRQVPLERDINIAVNGCSGFATSTQKGPFTAIFISRSRGTCLITNDSYLHVIDVDLELLDSLCDCGGRHLLLAVVADPVGPAVSGYLDKQSGGGYWLGCNITLNPSHI